MRCEVKRCAEKVENYGQPPGTTGQESIAGNFAAFSIENTATQCVFPGANYNSIAMSSRHTPIECQRLGEADRGEVRWKFWGPYLAERQWGTVREDYSAQGDAWTYLPFEHAHSRAYRWGEDGLAGICDEHGRLYLALALWNGRDPILK